MIRYLQNAFNCSMCSTRTCTVLFTAHKAVPVEKLILHVSIFMSVTRRETSVPVGDETRVTSSRDFGLRGAK